MRERTPFARCQHTDSTLRRSTLLYCQYASSVCTPLQLLCGSLLCGLLHQARRPHPSWQAAMREVRMRGPG
jgi:hypothetical protein